MAYSFTYRGTDYSNYGLIVRRGPWQVLQDPRLDIHPRGGGDGSTFHGALYGMKHFATTCVVEGTSRQQMFSRLDSIIAGLDPAQGVGLLLLDRDQEGGGTSRGYYAVINGPINPEPKGIFACTFVLNWAVPSGVAVAASETTQNVTISSDPDTFDVPATGTVAGNKTAHPEWIITNTDAASVTGITLQNTTTSKTCTCNGTLAQNDKLKIESDPIQKFLQKSTDGGSTWVNAMADFDQDTDPFMDLEAGSQNAMSLTGISAGTVGITYRAEFR